MFNKVKRKAYGAYLSLLYLIPHIAITLLVGFNYACQVNLKDQNIEINKERCPPGLIHK